MPRRSQTPRHLAWRPLRGVQDWNVDQVFLRRSSGRVVVNVLLVSDQSGLRSERVYPPTSDALEAVRFAGRFVAGLGNVSRADNVRVRWARATASTPQDALYDDETLEVEFEDAFWAGLDELRDQMR